jgi:hypothetical protein
MNRLSKYLKLTVHLRTILVSSSNLRRLLNALFLIHCECITHLPYIVVLSHPFHSLSLKHIGNITRGKSCAVSLLKPKQQ